MTFMAAALPFISAAGTIVSTLGAISSGNAQQKAANYQAAQMDQQAGQERASAQRQAFEQRRKATLAGSRVTALAGASGAGVADPSVVDIMGDIQTQGEYNALSAMYTGEERARGYQMGADAKRFEGAEAKKAGYISAGGNLLSGVGNIGYRSTILNGGSSLLEKYG